jgi:hypothetical protein
MCPFHTGSVYRLFRMKRFQGLRCVFLFSTFAPRCWLSTVNQSTVKTQTWTSLHFFVLVCSSTTACFLRVNASLSIMFAWAKICSKYYTKADLYFFVFALSFFIRTHLILLFLEMWYLNIRRLYIYFNHFLFLQFFIVWSVLSSQTTPYLKSSFCNNVPSNVVRGHP